MFGHNDFSSHCACALCCLSAGDGMPRIDTGSLQGTGGGGTEPAAYVYGNRKWGTDATPGTSGGQVSWSFASTNYSGTSVQFDGYITDAAFRSTITQAFNAWEAVANIDFVYSATDAAGSNIRLGFDVIDGASRVLAQAWSHWNSNSLMQSAEIAFDIAESWATGTSVPTSSINLLAVAVHEIGHAIGLNHSTTSPAIMQAYYNASITSLQQDDIAAAQYVYGAAGTTPRTGDDYAADTSTTGSVAAGGTATGSIESNGDTDWFAITLTAGTTYTFNLEGSATSGGTLTDPMFRLYDATGRSVASDDDSGTGLNSRATYTATASGTFYAEADGYSSATGTYRLSVTSSSQSSQTIETITGTSQSEVLTGGSGAQVINAGAGDDTITGGAGDDTIEGGSGSDIAVYSGVSTEYSVTERNGQVQVIHLGTGTDGTDQLLNVEKLQFSDKLIAVTTPAPVAGTAADDTLASSTANESFDGGAGRDTVVLSAMRSQYTLTRDGSQVTLSGPDGNDTLSNVERLRFTDGTLVIDSADPAFSVYRLYQGALNRRPGLRPSTAATRVASR